MSNLKKTLKEMKKVLPGLMSPTLGCKASARHKKSVMYTIISHTDGMYNLLLKNNNIIRLPYSEINIVGHPIQLNDLIDVFYIYATKLDYGPIRCEREINFLVNEWQSNKFYEDQEPVIHNYILSMINDVRYLQQINPKN